MTSSDQVGELAKALAKAQGSMSPPVKNREVAVRSDKANYKFKYATLDSVIDACRAPLADNGLAIVQCPEADGNKVTIVTTLMHESGQWIRDSLTLMAAAIGPQAVGSIISYGRRYAITSMLGLASEEDDDGNAAEGHDAEGRDLPNRRKASPKEEARRQPAKKPDGDRPTATDKAKSMTMDERFQTFLDRCLVVPKDKWDTAVTTATGHPDFNAEQKALLFATLAVRKFEYDLGTAAESKDMAYKSAILQEERAEVLAQMEGLVMNDPRVLDRGAMLNMVAKRELELQGAAA